MFPNSPFTFFFNCIYFDFSKVIETVRKTFGWLIFIFIFSLILSKIGPFAIKVTLLTITDNYIQGLYYLSNTIFPAIIIILSIGVIVVENPIYALLALISVFFSMALLLLTLKVEFLAMIFLIIYIGAISILFLFVIMMFNLRTLRLTVKPLNFYISAFLYSFLLLPKFYFYVIDNVNPMIDNIVNHDVVVWNYVNTQAIDILLFSNNFYTTYSFLFILLGYILLTAMVGAIVLALSTNSTDIKI